MAKKKRKLPIKKTAKKPPTLAEAKRLIDSLPGGKSKKKKRSPKKKPTPREWRKIALERDAMVKTLGAKLLATEHKVAELTYHPNRIESELRHIVLGLNRLGIGVVLEDGVPNTVTFIKNGVEVKVPYPRLMELGWYRIVEMFQVFPKGGAALGNDEAANDAYQKGLQ